MPWTENLLATNGRRWAESKSLRRGDQHGAISPQPVLNARVFSRTFIPMDAGYNCV